MVLAEGQGNESCVLSTLFATRSWPADSCPSLVYIPVGHWWQVSGSVPAQLGCLTQAGLSGYTAAGRHSAAPRTGQRQRAQRSEHNLIQAYFPWPDLGIAHALQVPPRSLP